MIDLVEWVADRIYALQITTWQQWLLRGLLLAAGAGTAQMAAAWVVPGALPAWWAVTGVLLLASVVRPDSLAPLLTLVMVALAWFGGGAGGLWWQYVAVVSLASLFHLLAAYATAAPPFAVVRGRVARRMVAATVAFVAVSALVVLSTSTLVGVSGGG